MLEIAQDLEQTAVWFKPVILIGPGLAAVLLGLFVWLGGLGFRRALVAILGAVSGGICGFFIAGRNIVPVMVSAGVAAAIAIMFEKIFITILAAVLAAALGFAVLARPYIESADSLKRYPEHETQKMTASLSTSQTVKTMKVYIVDFIAAIKQTCLHMPVSRWVIIGTLAVIFIVVGFFQRRFTSAFCCATLGTTLVFAGMILLLLYKGTAPISRICRNQSFYLGVFAAMAVFGVTEQLLLCQRIKGKSTRKKETSKKKEGEKILEDWRNR